MKKQIGFIGAGNMATAIINGMIKNGAFSPSDIHVFDIDNGKLNAMADRGVRVHDSARRIVEACGIIVLAVKPQNYKDVLTPLRADITEEKVFVSIAAGISIDFVRKALCCDCPCVRVMPNTPLLLGLGASALCPSENISDEDFQTVYNMFALSGVCEILPESQMNTIIAVNGSSPAYVYLFAKAMADYAKEQGIDEEAARRLICQTLQGSAQMLLDSGDTPDVLIKKVSSPGGTTLEALKTLEQNHFYEAIKEAMASCTRRAEEVGQK